MDGSNFASALPIVMAASDEHYFRKHAVGFAKSALAAGHNVHLVVSPAPGPGLPKRARQIEKDVVTPFLARFAASEIARLVVEVVENPRATAEMTDNEAVVFINRCVSSIFRHFFGTTADRLLSSTLTVWSCNQFLSDVTPKWGYTSGLAIRRERLTSNAKECRFSEQWSMPIRRARRSLMKLANISTVIKDVTTLTNTRFIARTWLMKMCEF